VVHIASHGVFGDSADDTFIMTFDELLTLDGLQALLRDPRLRGAPIELITLSACQTAEGDDRAPLGMSGTALKARARSALGTLWPVSDAAASTLMAQFYRLLADGRHSKIGALREAQIELLKNPAQRHPFFWAPFILIGDWS
jgi:CHAT domain-containing protein